MRMFRTRLQAPGLSETPASLTLLDDGSVELAIAGGEPLGLEGLVFNTRNRFQASTQGDFPALFAGAGDEATEATIRPNLLKDGERLVGYLQVERAVEGRSYAVGVFAEFVKVE